MPKHTLEHGRCSIAVEDLGFFLTDADGNAVVNRVARGDWSLRCIGDPTAPSPKWVFVYHGKVDNMVSPVLTLDKNDQHNNIIITDLKGEPSEEQMWTLEDAVMVFIFPPRVSARIQSVAKPELSAGIDYLKAATNESVNLNVRGYPNEGSPRWNLDFILVEE